QKARRHLGHSRPHPVGHGGDRGMTGGAGAQTTTLNGNRAAREAELSPSGRWVGAALPRKEDRRMLTGCGRFTGDFTRPGMLHAAFARSPFAAALELPGVAAVLTAADLGRPFLRAVLERDEFVPTPMPMLADDEVRFAGEPV